MKSWQQKLAAMATPEESQAIEKSLAKTPAERKATERSRRAAQGLKEVRGLWATPTQEKQIKIHYHELVSE